VLFFYRLCFRAPLRIPRPTPARVTAAFAAFNFPWLVGIAGLVFIPWTALMYVLIFPLNSWDWLWLGIAIALDIFTYTSGMYKRKAIPYYPETAP
jgi:hypothetical protein